MSPTSYPSKRQPRAVIRRKHFERPDEPIRLDVTDRDLDVLEEVARHRFLSSRQIAALVPGTPEKIAKRCGKLFATGLLDKPRRQIDYFVPGGGSRPHVFAISNGGASLLVQQRRAHDIDDLDWAKKNKEAGRVFIAHTLDVADVSIALTRAGRNRLDHKILHQEALLSTLPAETQARDKPWAWGPATLPPHYGVGRTAAAVTNVPDHAFRIDLPDGTRRAFLVECDRASMPVVRKNLYQTSLLKKLLGYHFGHRLKLHQTLYGWAGLRFLLITTTPARVDNIPVAVTVDSTSGRTRGFAVIREGSSRPDGPPGPSTANKGS